MARSKKWLRVRKPRVYLGQDGIQVSPPSVRVGGKTGINIGRRGVSFSTGGKWWSFNSRRGCLLKLPGALLLILLLVGGVAGLSFWERS